MFLNEAKSVTLQNFIASADVKKLHKVIGVRDLTDDTFVIRLEKKQLSFRAGQHIQLRIPGRTDGFRVYSIYSAEADPWIEVLVKEIKEGYFTPLLRKVHSNEFLEVKGPSGHYHLRLADIESRTFLFIASGTGISPFRSFVLSYPQLKYKLLHGVRFAHEAYDADTYDSSRVVVCTTGDNKGNFNGRVTNYLTDSVLDTQSLVYLCGNSAMITESIDILKSKGFKNDQIFIESYF